MGINLACSAVRSDRNGVALWSSKILATFIEEICDNEIRILRSQIDNPFKSGVLGYKNQVKKSFEVRGMSWLKSAWYRNWVNWIVAPNSTFSFLRVCTFSRFDPPSMKLFFYLVFIVKFMGFKRIFHWESQTRHLVATTLLDKFLLKHFTPFSDSCCFCFRCTCGTIRWSQILHFLFQIRLIVTLELFCDSKTPKSNTSETFEKS